MAENFNHTRLEDSDDMFLHELRGETASLLDRHNTSPKVFVPSELDEEIIQAIHDGRYQPESEIIDQAVADALAVNVLTEDGLPYYTSTLLAKARKDHPFMDWVRQWTAEEGRHSPALMAVIRGCRQINLRWLEKARMHANSHPDTPQPESLVEGLIYTSIQEPATEISHRNTLKRLPEIHFKFGRKAMGYVIGDEVRHGLFYGDMSSAALEINPSLTIIGIARQMKNFAMPGKAIPDFKERSAAIARAGIFNLEELKGIYDRLFEQRWKIWDKTGLTPEAEQAREFIGRKLAQMTVTLQRLKSRDE